MKALIIDHHDASAQILSGKLKEQGYEVIYEPTKQRALELLSQHAVDVVFLDPSPQSDARQYVRDMRRHAVSYPYVFLTVESADPQSFLQDAVNDVFPKPFAVDILPEKLSNVRRFLSLLAHMRQTSPDFPSAGGVISKSAFLQLFLSGLDRADRYEERSFVITIGIENYKEILDLDGPYGANSYVAQLSQYLALNRRQSDIVGQTGVSEFSLLLLRPLYETEPVDAAVRLAQTLSEVQFLGGQKSGHVELMLQLVDLPTASNLTTHRIRV